MFQSIGKFVTRGPVLWIVFWIGLVIALHFLSSDWDTLVSEGELEHLPSDSPSLVAGRLFEDAFPNARSDSNIVILLRRPDKELEPNDYLFMAQDLVPRLQAIADRYGGVLEPSVLQRLEQAILEEQQELQEQQEQQEQQERQEQQEQQEREGVREPEAVGGEHAAPEKPEASEVREDTEEIDEGIGDEVREQPGGDLEEEAEDEVPREPGEEAEEDGKLKLRPVRAERTVADAPVAGDPVAGDPVADGPETATRPAEASPEVQVVSISAPHNSAIGPLLVSSDDQAMLVVVQLTTPFLTSENEPLIEDVEGALEQFRASGEKPVGLELHLTGSAILGRDVVAAVTESTDAVQNWTIWLALALLIVVFRAPLVAVIPLVTLFIALQVSLDLLALLASGGVLQVYDGLQIYITVIVYGAGVDYSMFLISRFREELLHGAMVRKALVIAIAKVGAAIVISAGTEVAGVGTLSFAQFGKFSQAGNTIPIALVITLLASLTFTVALLQLAGKWGFWPMKLAKGPRKGDPQEQPHKDPSEPDFAYRVWERVGRLVQAAPLRVMGVTLLVMAPFCVVAAMNDNNLTYDITSGLPEGSPSLETNELLQEHFSKGIIGPVTVLLRSRDINFSTPEGLQALAEISENLRGEEVSFQVADLRALVSPLGTSPRARRFLELLEQAIPDRWEQLQQQVETQLDPAALASEAPPVLQALMLSEAQEYYVSQAEPFDRHVTRLTLILEKDPFSKESITSIDEIRSRILSAVPDRDIEAYILGPTASLYDVRSVAERDQNFMRLYVTLAVFVILVVLLRRFVVSVYLVLTVLLTYMTTIGVTFLLFSWLVGDDFAGLQWTVPVLLFTLLMAVGADYNVLLVERYGEEREEHDPNKAVVLATAATGGLISGAGLVMAGTFLALNVGGSMLTMQELGFALAFGVLVDTFLVRPLMVPAFLLLLDRWWSKLRDRLPGRRSDSSDQQPRPPKPKRRSRKLTQRETQP